MLVEHHLLLFEKSLRPQTREPKPRGRPQKNAHKKYLAAKQPLIEGSKPGKRAHAKDVTSENNIEEEVV